MNRELLEAQFRPDQIKSRKGNFGKNLAYLEAHSVIQRLNEALDATWSFDIIEHQVLQDEVLVLGKLTADSIVKTQFGTSTITRNKQTGEIVSLGDDLKAAATDALKKAATLLGVGLSLYKGNNGNGQNNNTSQNPPVNGRQGIRINGPGSLQNGPQGNMNNGYNQPTQPNFSENQQGQGPNRLSSKQLGFLHNIAKDQAMTRQELNNLAIKRFGTKVDFLTRQDASLLINDLIGAQNAA